MDKRKSLTVLVLRETKKFDVEFYPSRGIVLKRDEELSAIVADFGCNSSQVSKLVEHLTGRKVHISKKSVRLSTFVAFVALATSGGHNYRIGEAAVSKGGFSSCIRLDGSSGNSMSTYENTMRPATPEEIKAFVTKLPKDAVEDLMKNVVVVSEKELKEVK